MLQPLLGTFKGTTEDHHKPSIAQRLLSLVANAEEQANNELLKVDKEIQFNAWLFAKMDELLTPQGFVVCQNKASKDIMPNA